MAAAATADRSAAAQLVEPALIGSRRFFNPQVQCRSHWPTLVAIDVQDSRITQPALTDLPAGWADLPASGEAQEFGRRWLQSNNDLVMLVPSAIIPESSNALINPAHPAYAKVQLTIVRDFTFDARMFKC